MRGIGLGVAFWGAVCVAAVGMAQEVPVPEREARFVYHCAEVDQAQAEEMQTLLNAGYDRIEAFFGTSFKKPFDIEIHPSRAAFDAYFRDRWGLPNTERWMVASGVADRLTVLSPRVWKDEADEHDPADAAHLSGLLAHELVHVYHGQHNPKPEFDGMDDLGWFVEGLAVYVSGQLEREHRNAAHEAIESGKAPTQLATAWSGRYRYGVSGSMVEYVANRYGKETLKQMLSVTNNEEALALLGTTEAEFVGAWRKHVMEETPR